MHWEGDEIIDQTAWTQGRGLLFLTPHLGSFEITAQAYAQRYGQRQPITVMYRPARHRLLRDLEESARARPALAGRAGHAGRHPPDAARAEAWPGGRPAARPGAAERPGRVGRVLRQARLHDDLAARLAQQSGAPIVLAWCERLPGGRGFHLRLSRLAEALPTAAADAGALQQAQAQVINRAMQALILQCPQQYLWGYNRYKSPRSLPGAGP